MQRPLARRPDLLKSAYPRSHTEQEYQFLHFLQFEVHSVKKNKNCAVKIYLPVHPSSPKIKDSNDTKPYTRKKFNVAPPFQLTSNESVKPTSQNQ